MSQETPSKNTPDKGKKPASSSVGSSSSSESSVASSSASSSSNNVTSSTTNYVKNRVKAKRNSDPPSDSNRNTNEEDDSMEDDSMEDVEIVNNDDDREKPLAKSMKRKSVDNGSLKHHILSAYKELFNTSLDPSMSDTELYEELISAASDDYDDESDLEARFKYLQKRFASVLHKRDTPFQNMPPFKTDGYRLLFEKVNMIKNVVDSVRTSPEFSLADILEALEIVSILSQFCLISIKMGIEENFKAAKKFNDKFESGGSIYDVTSKTREKCVKKANLEIEREEAKKLRGKPKFQPPKGNPRRPFIPRQQGYNPPRYDNRNDFRNEYRNDYRNEDNRKDNRRFTADNSNSKDGGNNK